MKGHGSSGQNGNSSLIERREIVRSYSSGTRDGGRKPINNGSRRKIEENGLNGKRDGSEKMRRKDGKKRNREVMVIIISGKSGGSRMVTSGTVIIASEGRSGAREDMMSGRMRGETTTPIASDSAMMMIGHERKEVATVPKEDRRMMVMSADLLETATTIGRIEVIMETIMREETRTRKNDEAATTLLATRTSS